VLRGILEGICGKHFGATCASKKPWVRKIMMGVQRGKLLRFGGREVKAFSRSGGGSRRFFGVLGGGGGGKWQEEKKLSEKKPQ